jgi:hypothetical protein
VANLSIPVDFTIEAWVNPSTVQQDQMILAKEQAATQANQFRIGVDSGNAYFMMTDATTGGDLWTESDGYSLSAPISAGQWTHVAVTKNGTAFVLYLNGVSKATFATSTSVQHAGAALFELASHLASDGVTSEKFFDGTLDEIRLWDIARSAADIAADMGKTIPAAHPQYAHLIAYFKLDDAAGTTVADAIGQHPGTLVNGPVWVVSSAPTGM